MSEEKNKNRSGNKVIDIRKSNKIRPITFSTEELEDPEVDEMIRQSIKEEADRLEEELNNDPELMGVGASDDMFLSIVSRLKEQGVWEEAEEELPETEIPEEACTIEKVSDTDVTRSGSVDNEIKREEILVKNVDNLPENTEVCVKQEDIYRMLPEEDLQALMLGREVARQKEEKKVRRQRQRRRVRRIASVAAVFVVVFMAGMTSEANRRLVLKAWDAVMTVAGFKVDTDYAESEKVIQGRNAEEELAWKDVAEKLGVSALAFIYLPIGMEFEQYEVLEEIKLAVFMYSYQTNIVEIKIIENSDANSIYYVKDENAKLIECIRMDKSTEVEIWEINTESNMEIYLAEFEKNNCRYMVSGSISLEEIKKIIKNTIFL